MLASNDQPNLVLRRAARRCSLQWYDQGKDHLQGYVPITRVGWFKCCQMCHASFAYQSTKGTDIQLKDLHLVILMKGDLINDTSYSLFKFFLLSHNLISKRVFGWYGDENTHVQGNLQPGYPRYPPK